MAHAKIQFTPLEARIIEQQTLVRELEGRRQSLLQGYRLVTEAFLRHHRRTAPKLYFALKKDASANLEHLQMRYDLTLEEAVLRLQCSFDKCKPTLHRMELARRAKLREVRALLVKVSEVVTPTPEFVKNLEQGEITYKGLQEMKKVLREQAAAASPPPRRDNGTREREAQGHQMVQYASAA